MGSFEGLLVPEVGTIRPSARGWSIEVPLATFSADHAEGTEWRSGLDGPALIDASIQLDELPLPSRPDQLVRRSFSFPSNPDPGYVDGSLYLGSAHNPVDLRVLTFLALDDQELVCRLAGTIVFEFELWEVPNHDFDTDVRLRLIAPDRSPGPAS